MAGPEARGLQESCWLWPRADAPHLRCPWTPGFPPQGLALSLLHLKLTTLCYNYTTRVERDLFLSNGPWALCFLFLSRYKFF